MLELLAQTDPELVAFLVVLAAAAGAELGLALLVVGVAPQLGWPAPPGSLDLLQAPAVLASLVLLYGLEWWIERHPRGFALWHTLQRWVRVLVFGLVASMATAGMALELRVLFITGMTVLGTLVYLGASGWSALMILREMSARSQRIAALAMDVAFSALLVLALEEPTQALLALGALFVITGTQLPASIFAHRAVARAGQGWLHLLVLPGRWHDGDALPREIREATTRGSGPLVRPPSRGAPAALLTGSLRMGWLVLAADGAYFADGRRAPDRLEPIPAQPGRRGPLHVRKPVRLQDGEGQLLVYRDGPQLAELEREIGQTASP